MKLGLHRRREHGDRARARASASPCSSPTSMAARREALAARARRRGRRARNAEVAERGRRGRALPQAGAARGGGRGRSAAARQGRRARSSAPRRPSSSRRAYPGRAGLPLHAEHPRRGRPRRALLRGRPRAAEGPEQELLELFGRAGRRDAARGRALIEPAMALMSCGPAFLALVVEALRRRRRAPRPRPATTRPRWSSRRWPAPRRTCAHTASTRAALRAPRRPRRAAHRARPAALEEGGLRARLRRRRRRRSWRPTQMSLLAGDHRARRRGLRQHAGPRLPRPDLRPDPAELVPAHPVQPLSRRASLELRHDVTDPYLNLFRRFLPPVRIGPGALDLSPIVATFVLLIVGSIVVGADPTADA